MTSGLEKEWDYSGRKGRDGRNKKIRKANKRKGKVKTAKDEEVNGQGEKWEKEGGCPGPTQSKYMTHFTFLDAQCMVVKHSIC